jgi:hypothetical protein
VPLVVAILGLIGTVNGAIAGHRITQRRSDARDRAARKRERWAREDAAPHGRLLARGVYQVLCRRGAQINDFLENKGYLR